MQDFSLPGIGARIVAQIIDAVIVGIASSILIVPFFGLSMFNSAALSDPEEAGALLGMSMLPIMLISLVAPIIYETLMISSARQATLGKSIMKIKVVDENGQGLTTGAAAGRTLIKYLSGNFCFLLWLWPLFNKEEQALHDIIVKDFVVRA